MTDMNFDQNLNNYADVIVEVGLNLQPGQRLMVNSLLEAAPLARAVARSAYRKGCPYVDILWSDEQTTLIRFQEAQRDTFDLDSSYLAKATVEHVQQGGAFLGLLSANPDLLKDQDPTLVMQTQKARRQQMRPYYELLERNGFNWCLAGYPSPAWAAKVFPDLEPQEALRRLWQAVFQVCRLDRPDPVAAWQKQVQDFQARKAYLTSKQYSALHYTAPGTDLTVGLAEGHRWMGGTLNTLGGIDFIPNLPTEEVFTMPHRERIDGVVSSSKPLSYAGVMIEDFSLTFRGGQAVEAHARTGEEALRKLIATDAGAASLGEAALVPHSSPISASGVLFYNTLFDENAACHLALGNGFAFCLQGETTPEEYTARGGNTSLIHVDFMIGSGQMDIDGITPGGQAEPVMRQGEWAF